MTEDEITQNPFRTIRDHLFTAVIGDVMDLMGHRTQFLPPRITPLVPSFKLVGRAMPVIEEDVAAPPAPGAPQFGRMFEALDDLKPDEIYICTGSHLDYALWGELMTFRARHLQAAGAILDGFVRDTDGILAQDFPVFCTGSYAQDQGPRGKVTDWRVPITFGNGAHVAPGDILVGDRDGVLVIPQAIEAEVLVRSYEKVVGESKVRDAILAGMSTAEAYRTFGIM